MKLMAIILMLTSFSSGAQSLRSLKDVMSDLGDSFKIVTQNLQSGVISSKCC